MDGMEDRWVIWWRTGPIGEADHRQSWWEERLHPPVNVWIVFTQAALKQGVCQVHSSASIKMILEASEAQVKK